MFVIKNSVINEIIIKKSKFITYIYEINCINDAYVVLNEIRSKYNDATHICYSYIFENSIKIFDDKEPNGTAGLPIYNVLKKNNLTNIIAIVIRYYGGVKLGIGPLSRAYSSSVIEALKLTDFEEYIERYNIKLVTNYENKKLLELLTSNFNIINKVFDSNITYELLVTKDERDYILNSVNDDIMVI